MTTFLLLSLPALTIAGVFLPRVVLAFRTANRRVDADVAFMRAIPGGM